MKSIMRPFCEDRGRAGPELEGARRPCLPQPERTRPLCCSGAGHCGLCAFAWPQISAPVSVSVNGVATPAPVHSSRMPSSILSRPLLVLLALCLTSPGEGAAGSTQPGGPVTSRPIAARAWPVPCWRPCGWRAPPHPRSSSASQRVVQESPSELSETNPDRSHGAELNAVWASGEAL